MSIGNALVSALLSSPLHSLLSSSTSLVRYTGRRSGREFTTPTQYAFKDADVVIVVGRPETKTWWRNFRDDRDLEVMIRRRWVPMTARCVVGAEEPETVAFLLDAYLERFPKAVRALAGDTREARARGAVVVWCQPL